MERPEAKRSRPSWPSSRLRIPHRDDSSKRVLYPAHPLDDFDDDFLDDDDVVDIDFEEDPLDSSLTDDDPTLPSV